DPAWGPSADQSLIQHVLVRARWRPPPRAINMAGVQGAPMRHFLRPLLCEFAEREYARPCVLTAFRVVGCGRVHGVRRRPRPRTHESVKLFDGQSWQSRVVADFVERQQSVMAIEDRIFDRLRHDRSRKLLYLGGETL